jgi:hypothetical protein
MLVLPLSMRGCEIFPTSPAKTFLEERITVRIIRVKIESCGYTIFVEVWDG